MLLILTLGISACITSTRTTTAPLTSGRTGGGKRKLTVSFGRASAAGTAVARERGDAGQRCPRAPDTPVALRALVGVGAVIAEEPTGGQGTGSGQAVAVAGPQRGRHSCGAVTEAAATAAVDAAAGPHRVCQALREGRGRRCFGSGRAAKKCQM